MPTASEGRRYGRKTVDERREDRRARLLAFGLDAFGTQGYAATSIEAICAGANVSTRTFYEEFGSRERLLIAVHDQINAAALQGVLAALTATEADDLPTRIRAAARAYFDHMTSDRRYARVAVVESVGVSPAVEAARQTAIDGFVALIEVEGTRLADSGIIAARDFSLTAIALAGAVNGLINTWATNPDWEHQLPAVSEEAARLIVLGLTGPELQ